MGLDISNNEINSGPYKKTVKFRLQSAMKNHNFYTSASMTPMPMNTVHSNEHPDGYISPISSDDESVSPQRPTISPEQKKYSSPTRRNMEALD